MGKMRASIKARRRLLPARRGAAISAGIRIYMRPASIIVASGSVRQDYGTYIYIYIYNFYTYVHLASIMKTGNCNRKDCNCNFFPRKKLDNYNYNPYNYIFRSRPDLQSESVCR